MPDILKKRMKNNKSGVVLVTVLFIVAIAVIFIACSILMTTETRKRLYTTAEQNQARLTVTSVAEAFYQGLYDQSTIKDGVETRNFSTEEGTAGSLWAMARQNGQRDPNVNPWTSGSLVKLEFKNPGVPGMAGTDKNRTIGIPYMVDADKGQIAIDFRTVIGDQADNIRLYLMLQIKDPTPPNFKHGVEVGQSAWNANATYGGVGFAKEGAATRYEAEDNTYMTHGGAFTNSGTTYYYSTFIAMGQAEFGGNTYFGSDVIFYGADANARIVNQQMNGLGTAAKPTNYFFINNTRSMTGQTGVADPWFGRNPWNAVFSNSNSGDLRNIHIDTARPEGSVLAYINGASSTGVSSDHYETSISGTLSSLYNKYKSEDYYQMADVATWPNAAATYGFVQVEKNGTVAGAASLSAANSTTVTCSVNGKLTYDASTETYTLAPGTYIFNGSEWGERDQSHGKPAVRCDLSAGNYTFYVTKSLYFYSGAFYFTKGDNPDTTNTAMFIMAPNTGIFFGGNSPNGSHGNGNYHEATGIVCEWCHANGALPYSSALDQTQRPSVYMFGGPCTESEFQATGSNGENRGQVRISQSDKNFCVDAYVGLYPSSADATDAGAFVTYDANGRCHIYGRIMASALESYNGVAIPYCPAPVADEDSLDHSKTWFSILSYAYFYDDYLPASAT